MAKASDPYEVGYGRPPKDKQFKPGKSGNPKGRPKAPPKFEDLLAKEANKPITVTIDGQKKTLTQAEVVIKALVQKAMKGDLAAAKLVIIGLQTYPHPAESEGALTLHDLQLLKELLLEEPGTGSTGEGPGP
jgi:hypothetical protein